ncbi:MAG: hypothetical protein LBE81_03820, partial [Azonexus sp.]|uniref:BPSS1780 family membrane protein n=1 Tax=Azonexus sp. TaxID=1872668 RepID=UPI0028265235
HPRMSESPTFPLAPTPFTGDSREVDAGACFDWLQQGWLLFLANPGVWIGCTVLLLVILMAISVVPVFGQIAVHLLVPVFGAGMFQICRQLASGGEAQIADLFIGFRHNAGPLVMVGVIYAASVFGLAFMAFLLVSGGILGGAITGSVAGFGITFGGIMLAGLLVMVLSVPVIMATWFAPALVLFHDMKPGAAMRASFAAGARNWVAMVIFGIFLSVALFFAMLPFFLGLLLLLPIFSGAVYASYRDIFEGA